MIEGADEAKNLDLSGETNIRSFQIRCSQQSRIHLKHFGAKSVLCFIGHDDFYRMNDDTLPPRRWGDKTPRPGVIACAYASPGVRRATIMGPPSANLHNFGSRTQNLDCADFGRLTHRETLGCSSISSETSRIVWQGH
jgi:hypothetical protein